LHGMPAEKAGAPSDLMPASRLTLLSRKNSRKL
jgi:hypothetical protein